MKKEIHEHILVCLSSAPSNGNTIRAAAKLSQAFGGTLTALYVQTNGSDQMGAEDRRRLQQHTRLAEQLGASVSTVTGDDVAFQIAEFARLSKATKIVLGRSAVPKGRLFAPKPLTEQLVELAPDLDIYIIPDSAGRNKQRQNPATRQSILPTVRDWLITAGILAMSTALGFVFHRLKFTEANTITVYIFGVLLTALYTKNYVCSGISSLAGVLLFNFFFTEPRLTFYAYESGYPVTFAIMLFASLLTGTLANRLAVLAKRSAQAAWRTQVLLETTQQLDQAEDEPQILEVVAGQLLKLLNRPIVLRCTGGDTIRRVPEQEPFDFSADGVPQSFSLQCAGKKFGDVLIYGSALEPLESSILHSILGEGALAIESRQNSRQKEEAAVLAKNEQLRANLLRSISHDLRTPLTSISGNAENLLSNGQTMEASDRKAVLTDIYEDSVWLIRLVENLLEGIEVRLGVDYLENKAELDALAEKVVYTGPIDAYYGYKLGALEYRSVRFETELLDIPNFQGTAAVNYTDAETPYTRIFEHKWFTFGKDERGNDLPKTVISREYSSEWHPGDEPYYPVNDEKNSALYAKYKALAEQEEKVIFGGRLGEYKYYDMDAVIAAALAAAETVI